MHCFVDKCAHVFLTRWYPDKKDKKPIVVPPFTTLNSITMQAMRKHFQRDHEPPKLGQYAIEA